MSTTIAALNGPQINHAEFVQLVGPTFNNTWCNAASDITVNSTVYLGLGTYLGIAEIQQDLKGTSVDLKLMISHCCLLKMIYFLPFSVTLKAHCQLLADFALTLPFASEIGRAHV